MRFRDRFLDEWDDMAYMIKRGKIEQVKKLIKENRKFKLYTPWREGGDTILHVAAEYN